MGAVRQPRRREQDDDAAGVCWQVILRHSSNKKGQLTQTVSQGVRARAPVPQGANMGAGGRVTAPVVRCGFGSQPRQPSVVAFAFALLLNTATAQRGRAAQVAGCDTAGRACLCITTQYNFFTSEFFATLKS